MRIPHPDPIKDAEARMAALLADAMYGQSAEDRVRELRRSILKDECPPDNRIMGLAEILK